MGSTAQELLTCFLRQGLSLGLRADQLGCTGRPVRPEDPLACASLALDYSVPRCPAFLFVLTVLTRNSSSYALQQALQTELSPQPLTLWGNLVHSLHWRPVGWYSGIPCAVTHPNTFVEALTVCAHQVGLGWLTLLSQFPKSWGFSSNALRCPV